MGTSLEKMSGPVTLGSVGFTGKALTSGAPGSKKAPECISMLRSMHVANNNRLYIIN